MSNMKEGPGKIEWRRGEANGSLETVPPESGPIRRACLRACIFVKATWELGADDPRKVVHCLKVGVALTIVSLFYYMRPLYEGVGGTSMWVIMTVLVIFEYTVVDKWKVKAMGILHGVTICKCLNRATATFLAGFRAVGVHWIASQSGDRLEPIIVGVVGDLHRRTKVNSRGEAAQKPLRRGDQTKAMTAGKRAQRRVVEYVEHTFERWGSGLFIDGVMGRVHGSRRDPRKDRPSILPRPRARRRPLHLRSTNEYPGSGSGELSGDRLARFHAEREGSSFMTDEINQSPSSPMEGSPEASPLIAIHPSVEKKTNIMTLEELNALRDTYSFPPGVRIRLPDEGETITSTRPSKVRNKKVLLGGYPSNVKGWKSEFFFVFGDKWDIPEGTSREGAPRVPRTWGIPSRASRMAGDNLSSGDTPSSSSDVGESQNPHEQARRESPSRDDSIDCLGSIRTELRRMLPHIPDLTLLRWSGGKVLDPILDRFMNAPSSSSNFSSESCSDSSLPVELESDAMSKRISFKKIGEKLGKSADVSSGTPVPTKGVVIGEKRARESITSSPSKRGKDDDGSKGKRVDSGPEGKKKATSSSKATATPTAASSRPREGTSANLGTVPGPTASILGNPFVVEKLLRGVIPPADKEKVEKLTLDQTATKLFHVIGQTLVLDSSLVVRSRKAGEQASLQEGRVASMETEVARLRKLAADLEQQLAESRACEQQANDELAKMKSDRDSLADKLERSGVLVNELREALDKAKESAVEEFKSSSEFVVAVEDSAFKYFSEGFDFCKV
ncbi:aluminum activated malate transporter family protein [Actinidia rufa]|uniref:Aluminum activated malate transporter family protein n=1 Tax=Actinidia rufa TaxID=165716 RepID=A0A7J0GPL2_9ERIC|nr:aluminum activated malate transporter family protein [Actinidia rufa]